MNISRRRFVALCGGAVSGIWLASKGLLRLPRAFSRNPVIKVIGIGGGGGNAIEHMVQAKIDGMEFVAANTDAQALRFMSARTLLLGSNLTWGLGAGADPEIGKRAAMEDRERLAEVLTGADVAFIVAGMGGGTGTGGAPVIAQVAKDLNIPTVAVVTTPFPFEGRKRMRVAEQGIKALTSEYVDLASLIAERGYKKAMAQYAEWPSVVTIPHDKLLTVLGRRISLLDIFRASNNVVLGVVQGIAESIRQPDPDIDFALGVHSAAEIYEVLLAQPHMLLAFAEPYANQG
jgi:cell division protein FtsZ